MRISAKNKYVDKERFSVYSNCMIMNHTVNDTWR